ncbi:hypothetical protein G4B88_018407 [Cannabis sativa]|uniref:MRH domain-containing protein n=1 Tax=Cannabis sativa TaxID=3483 RepID=A0A7J6DL82_CANSA|nr:hypothetical protein G4B88_018407 [Cannabis sativa]
MRVALFLSISFSLFHFLLAEQVLQFHVGGGSFARSSREPKYNIKFHSEDSLYHPEDDQESVVMPNNNGQNYLCYLPKVEKVKSGKTVTQHNISSMIVESEKRIKLKTPDELLEELRDRCFVRQEGWWSYEFCYPKRVRQLHLEEEKVVQEFILGEYHAHQYTNGTLCDLTNQPRETEVRFVCSEPRAMISSLTELSTCKYALTVRSPMLCQHPLFQAERPVWYTIHCNELPKDKETRVAEEFQKSKQIVTVAEDEDTSNDLS